MLATSNPETKYAVIRIMMALTINKNNPSVKMVIGRVRNTKIGRTKNCSNASTIATRMAVENLSKVTPLNIFGNK